MGRARAARAARAVFIGGFSPKTSNRKHSGRSGRSGPALLAPFCDPLFGTFLRTVCKDNQKTTTLWGSKMTPMSNSLALWPSPPLAMSSLASGRSGTRRGMHAYSWWGSSPRIFSFARSNSASVRRPSRFHSMSSRVAPRLTEATQRPSWLGSPCSLSSQVEPCWRLPSVLSCWAAHAHFHPISNPAGGYPASFLAGQPMLTVAPCRTRRRWRPCPMVTSRRRDVS